MQTHIISEAFEDLSNMIKKKNLVEADFSSIKPYGGDKKNYWMFYVGPGYPSQKEIKQFGKDNGCTTMWWGSDEATAYKFKGTYNGDTLIVCKDVEKLPAGYKEDAKQYGELIESKIVEDYYDEYKSIIQKINSAKSQAELIEIDDLIQHSIYADDARRGVDDSNNYFSLQASLFRKMQQLNEAIRKDTQRRKKTNQMKKVAEDFEECNLTKMVEESNQKSRRVRQSQEDYKVFDFGKDRFGNKIRWYDVEGTLIEDEPDYPWKYNVDGFGYFTKKHALNSVNGDITRVKLIDESLSRRVKEQKNQKLRHNFKF